MAGKGSHANEEPVGWVTIRGVHFPKWADGTIGWQEGEADKKRREYKDAVEKMAREHTEKIMTRTTANRELYDEADKWAKEHHMDTKLVQDDAFKRMNELHSEAIQRGDHKTPKTYEEKKASFEKADTETLKDTLHTLEVTHRWGDPSPDAQVIRDVIAEREKPVSKNARYDTSKAKGAKKPSKPKNSEDLWFNFMTAEDRQKVFAALRDPNLENAVIDNRKHGEKMESILGKVWLAMKNRDSAKPIRQLPKDLKNLKKGEYFTKKDIDEPKESQVWIRGDWVPSAKAYNCYRFSDVNDDTLLKSDAEVWTDFYF